MSASNYLDLINNSAQANGVPPALLYGVIQHESGGNPNAINQDSNGSVDRGLAQINSAAHPDVTAAQAYDPNFAIPYSAHYLANLYNKYGSWDSALAAYNSGSPTGDQSYVNAVKTASAGYSGAQTGTSATGASATGTSATGANATGTSATGGVNLLTVGTVVFAAALILIAVNKM